MSVIMIKNARLSFPEIWTPKAFNEGQAPKFSCNLLLDKEGDKAQIVSFKKAIKEAALAGFNGELPAGLKSCIGDGKEKSYDGYENAMFGPRCLHFRRRLQNADLERKSPRCFNGQTSHQ